MLSGLNTRIAGDGALSGQPTRNPVGRAPYGDRVMAKPVTSFTCTSCGQASLRWMGRCPGCGEWNTLVEEKAVDRLADRRVGPRDGRSVGRRSKAAEPRKPVVLAEVEAGEVTRLRTGSEELDRVLGGGLVPGSVVLIGGSPGIGKSTLMSAALASIQSGGGRPLYVSGEESAAQVKLRAERLGPHALAVPVLAETSLEVVLATLEQERPAGLRDRLGADTLVGRPDRQPRQRRPGAGGRRRARALCA